MLFLWLGMAMLPMLTLSWSRLEADSQERR